MWGVSRGTEVHKEGGCGAFHPTLSGHKASEPEPRFLTVGEEPAVTGQPLAQPGSPW